MRPLIALALGLAVLSADGRDLRQREAFRKQNPCPATGRTKGACPGYVVDHIWPLCAGGADHPKNMQWQTVAAGKKKDREEAAECAEIRRTKRL